MTAYIAGCPGCSLPLVDVAPERALDSDANPQTVHLEGTCPRCRAAVAEPSWAWLPFTPNQARTA